MSDFIGDTTVEMYWSDLTATPTVHLTLWLGAARRIISKVTRYQNVVV